MLCPHVPMFCLHVPMLSACHALPPQDILAPLLHVNELRRHGVTLHMLLDAERQPIPDVPAVYFVQVLQLIAADCCGLPLTDTAMQADIACKRRLGS